MSPLNLRESSCTRGLPQKRLLVLWRSGHLRTVSSGSPESSVGTSAAGHSNAETASGAPDSCPCAAQRHI